MAALSRTGDTIEGRIHRGQQPGVVVSLASDHDTIHMLELLATPFQCRDTAIDADMQLRSASLEPVHPWVVKRRNITVLFGREPLQPRFACVHDKSIATGIRDLGDKALQIGILILVVDADTAFHRDRNAYRITHGPHRSRHLFRIPHQTRPDQVVLHTVAGTADVEIDLVIAPRLGNGSALCQLARIAATQLQRDWMLDLIVAKETLPRATMQNGPGGDHFGIEQIVASQRPRENAVVTCSPIHHRNDGKRPIQRRARRASIHAGCGGCLLSHICSYLQWLCYVLQYVLAHFWTGKLEKFGPSGG